MIVGDNGDIFRIVGATRRVPRRSTTTTTRRALRIVPRAVELLDYTPGGVDVQPGARRNDRGAADEIHGESGDDFIYGQVGSDVIFGDGQDDNLVGGYGSDWISGGTGDDGILGDDGRIYVSRISSSFGEPLYGIAAIPAAAARPADQQRRAARSEAIDQPGGRAQVHGRPDARQPRPGRPRQRRRRADPYYRPPLGVANDVIYGGLGNDSIHGGAGDDAISGAEAPTESYTNNYDQNGNLRRRPTSAATSSTRTTRATSSATTRPTTDQFALYDPNDALREVLLTPGTGALYTGAIDPTLQTTAAYHNWLLNFDYTEGPIDTKWIVGSTYAGVPTDGNDMLFGDLQQRLGRRRHRPRHRRSSAGATTSATPTTS